MNTLNRAALVANLRERAELIRNTVQVRAPNRIDPFVLIKLLDDAAFDLDKAAEALTQSPPHDR